MEEYLKISSRETYNAKCSLRQEGALFDFHPFSLIQIICAQEIDEWLPATIVHRHEKPIPNTSITLKSFDVEYVITTPDGAETRELENDIRSDRLRIPSSEKGEGYQVYEGYTPAPLPVQSVIQETTGLGGWQTVSVKVVDETKEWEEHQAAIEEMRKDQSELVGVHILHFSGIDGRMCLLDSNRYCQRIPGRLLKMMVQLEEKSTKGS